MKLKKCTAALLVSSCLLTGCSSSAKKVDSKYVVASLSKGNKTKNIKERASGYCSILWKYRTDLL